MSKPAKVSVIIPCYNLGQYVEEAIDSVLNQTYQDFEVIVVNDGSIDEKTNEILHSIKKDKVTIKHIQNRGLAGARNYGIENSSGEYICCLDADDKLDPEYLEKTVEILEKDEKHEYGFVCSWIQHFGDINSIWKTSDYNPIKLAVNNVVEVSSVFRREAYEKAGKYRKMSYAGYEDWNLWISMVANGYRWSCIKEPLFYYRKRGGSMLSNATLHRVELYREIIEDNKEFFKNNAIEILKEISDQSEYFLNIEKNNQTEFKTIRRMLETALNNLEKAKKDYNSIKKDVVLLNEENKKLDQKAIELEHALQMANRFKLLRLRNVIVHERFSLKKLLKVIYLIGAIIIPEPLRRPLRKSLKKTISKLRQIQSTKRVKTIVQKQWPTNLPLVSVIIPCFNYGQYVEDAIDSVVAQTFGNLEIIVVEGGSTDGMTADILKNLKKDKTTIYFREGRHLPGDNRNFGISKAKGKYICCLDADDKLKPTYIEKALYLLETQNYDIASCYTHMFEESDQIYNLSAYIDLELMLNGNHINTAAIFRKDLWKKVGGYVDHGVGKDHIPEDWELWIKMMAAGARATNVTEPLFLYRIHGVSLSNERNVPTYDEQIEQIKKINSNILTSRNFNHSKRINHLEHKVKNGPVNLLYSASIDPRIIESKNTKTLFLLPYTVAGGADKRYQQIMNLLLSNNYDISLITTLAFESIHYDTNEDYEKKITNIFHLPRFLDTRYWDDFILYFIRSREIKVFYQGSSAYVYDLFPKIKELFPDIYIIDQQFNSIGHFPNNRKYAKYIDHTIAENNELKSLLVEKHKEDPSKVTQILSGVDTNKLILENYRKQKPQDLPDNKTLVMYIGRLSPEKGPDVFIEIANKLKNDDRFFFYIAGPGPEYDNCLKLIKKYRLENIKLNGMVDGLTYMSYADIFVVPSRIDGRPYAVLEGLSLGLPIIAASVGGLPDIIKDGKNGLLCKSEDIDDFAEKIILLTEDKDFKEKLQKQAREYAVETFDIRIENQTYLKVFGRK